MIAFVRENVPADDLGFSEEQQDRYNRLVEQEAAQQQ